MSADVTHSASVDRSFAFVSLFFHMAVDGDMRGDLALAQGPHEAFNIEGLGCAKCDPPFTRPMLVDQVESGLTLGRAGRRLNSRSIHRVRQAMRRECLFSMKTI